MHRLRTLHRWLAITVGLQWLAWIGGGIYFAWSDLDWIHGDHLVQRSAAPPPGDISPAIVAGVLEHLRRRETVTAWQDVAFVEILGEAVIRVHYRTPAGRRTALFSAADGHPLPPLDRERAVAVARAAFTADAPVVEVTYLREVPAGHEYRGHPLPAWGVTFAHPGRPTVYVAAEEGVVSAVRHDGWRVFDFLWMLHTLDFHGRDDIDNPLLRALSLAALGVVASGYLLYARLRARRRKTAIQR